MSCTFITADYVADVVASLVTIASVPSTRGMFAMRDPSSGVNRAAAQVRDAALVDRIREGDASALGELMQHYMLQLTAVAAAVLGSDSLVEDIVQDIFLAFWDQRLALDTPRNVAGYLHRAVRNQSVSVLRRERSQQRIADDAAARDTDIPRVAQNDADRLLEAAEIDAQVRAALVHLSPSPREVFLLSWNAGLTYREIAELLGITQASVAKQMYRATKLLSAHISRSTP